MGRIHLGVDVGGTFTHAVAYEVEDQRVLGAVRVPTTHTAAEGVAAGIVASIERLLARTGISPASIALVAHSTTQATNALLEGDTAVVGVLGIGAGVLPARERSQTMIGAMPLAPGRHLRTLHAWIPDPGGDLARRARDAVKALCDAGAEAIVVSQAFAVDDPAVEEAVLAAVAGEDRLVTPAAALARVYGLKARTRTACINAAILPRMMHTAMHTRTSLGRLSLEAPLMVMRSDGGIMGLDEVRRRPILTILSGPAAGVAAALGYSRIADGIFLEVGGTSTDVSCIRDGKARRHGAQVGGHNLLLRTLDVRTVGIAGGSLARLDARARPAGVGPRSAHIAGLAYASFTPGLSTERLELSPIQEGTARYLALRRPGGGPPVAITTTCAANILGLVPAGEEARADFDSVRAAFGAWSQESGLAPEDLARRMLDIACGPLEDVVEALRREYRLEQDLVVLVGGGGGAYALVPHLASRTGYRYKVVEHATVISAIGTASAMLRETIERSASRPGEAEIAALRREAVERVVAGGADRRTVEVEVEVDAVRGLVRVSASGASALEHRDGTALPADELERRAADGLETAARAGGTGALSLFWAGPADRRVLRVLDSRGRLRLQRRGATVCASTAGRVLDRMLPFLEQASRYGDSGRELPECFLLFAERVVDLSSLATPEQVQSVARLELEGLGPDSSAYVLAVERP